MVADKMLALKCNCFCQRMLGSIAAAHYVLAPGKWVRAKRNLITWINRMPFSTELVFISLPRILKKTARTKEVPQFDIHQVDS